MHEKLERYSLATGHDVGGPKAVLFELLLGITLEHVDHLEAEILCESGDSRSPACGKRPMGRDARCSSQFAACTSTKPT